MFLEAWRDRDITMLEIGLYKGASLNMWQEYFPRGFVYGLDINGPEQRGDRFHVIKGDQADRRSLESFAGKNLDLIVDDRSHVPEHQLSAFAYLFSNALRAGGTYIIEDIETSYWRHGELYGYDFRYGFRSPKSVIEVFKHAADFVNDEFMRDDDRIVRDGSPGIEPDAMKEIAMVTFAQNCVIVQKKTHQDAAYDNREYRRSKFL